jgi:hypothetical protein
MSSWRPIERAELEDVLSKELAECIPEQRAFFERHRVPFYKVPIHRLGGTDEVFVIAEFPNGVVYYEDIEEGFEFDILGPDGAIPAQGCNQYKLTHMLYRLGFNSPVNADAAQVPPRLP